MATSETHSTEHDEASSLIPSVSIESMVRMRAAVIERIKGAVQAIREANEIAEAAHLGRLDARVYLTYAHHCPFGDEEVLQHAQRQIDGPAWRHLMSESGLWSFLDAKARREWDQQIERGAIPPFTPNNVAATFRNLHEQRGEMFERGILECFRQLSFDYRTNQPVKLGKRLILDRLFEPYGHGKDRWLSLPPRATDPLDDLVRVLSVLSGRLEPDHRQGMHSNLRQAQNAGQMQWEGEYFSLRWYWKGSAHLTFKRMDLIACLNAILAKHFPNALPAPPA